MPPQQQLQQGDGGQSYGPGGPPPLGFEVFGGVNTATTRIGVQDEQAYWLDGFMPLAPRNLRTLYGIGNALYAATGALTIVCFYFYNLGANPYVVLFLSDGSAIQVNTSTGVATTILPSGSIIFPSITTLGISQWGSQYLIIVAAQPNGYWIWDGLVLYSSGTLAPGVTLTNVGNGYHTPPIVTATGGFGYGATFSASIANGIVTGVTITNPGQGYHAGDVVTLVFTGGTQAGSGASITASLTHTGGGSGASFTMYFTYLGNSGAYAIYVFTSISVNNGGSGYSGLATPILSVGSGFWYNNVAPGLSFTVSGGVITAVNISTPPGRTGWEYFSPAPFNLPTLSVNDPGYYYVSSVAIGNGGSNYSPATTLSASGGGTPYAEATFSPIINNGVIVGVTITSFGYYGTNSAPTVTATDTSTSAAGTVSLTPYGISGNFVETYQGHVWVLNGANVLVSAPGSVFNFATSAGGVQFTSEDSFLKVGYVAAVQTNGFLFLIGDNSMNYISGVTTTVTGSGPPTTTFTNNNSDPEIGTPYPASVTTLGQEILIANSTGVFVSSGGAFVKRSEPLDGVYNTVPATQFNANPFNGFQLSSAKATIFGKRVWMVLVPIVDPVSNTQVNKILMFNGKFWWSSMQDVPLTFISGQEINSIYTAWGTDGTHLYPLFNQPSTAITKVAQTRLWDGPGGYEFAKATGRFWSMWECYNTMYTAITLDVDAVGISASGQFTNTQPYTIAGPAAIGYFVTPPQAVGQNGILTGMTISTKAADMALVSAKLGDIVVGYTG